MPRQPIAIPYALRDALQSGLTHYKIMFLSAPTGWGKTAAVSKLLEKQNAVCLSLRKKPLPSYFSKERVILLDDFQELPPQAEQQFRELLRKSPRGQRFVLLSRGPLPGYLTLYEATGALLQLDWAIWRWIWSVWRSLPRTGISPFPPTISGGSGMRPADARWR